MSLIFIGISVANTQGIDAEKKSTSVIQITAITNFVWIPAVVDIIAGTYISAIVIVDALATNSASGMPSSDVIG